MKDIECPYCEEWQEVDHDDGVGYEEDVAFQQECRDCNKTFIFYTSILYCYEAQKANCLNGKKHNFELTYTQPREYSRMRCSMCDEEREPTKQERVKYKLNVKD